MESYAKAIGRCLKMCLQKFTIYNELKLVDILSDQVKKWTQRDRSRTLFIMA